MTRKLVDGEIEVVRGGRVARVGHEDGDLLLVVAGLRRFGLGWTARLRFVEAGNLESYDERSGTTAQPLRPGWDVEALRFGGVRAVLRVSRSTGPGDRDVVTVSLRCRTVRIVVRPSLRGTLIRLASV